ncbi:hypothetical protein ARMA_0887 [Ardenticatena maritima]|uniref:Putative zinc-finger domain-containing protein n=1 Tax=Ardenticatena maritima TaxID=872965 RepID=A0A0M9UC21_9CHLR|nr:zf-HC2 domain-containing protein [Ardenticatena maritima]KPL89426.1 hypothetical protein SE16_02970 [Ardenticatena maritima]GAP62464.1 hypothetical protein ARMA_0887 [Ardenticatena maritima]
MHINPETLSAYLDNEVSAEEREAIEAHLSACAECRRELDELRWTVSLMAQLPEVREPRPFYVRRADLEPARPRWQTWLAAWRPLFRVASYAGTAIVLLLLVLNVLSLATPMAEAPMPTAMEMQMDMQAESAPAEKAAPPAGEAFITAEEESAAEASEESGIESMQAEEAPSALTRTITQTGAAGSAASADIAAASATPEAAPSAPPPTVEKPLLALPRLTLAALLFTLLAVILYQGSSRWAPPNR